MESTQSKAMVTERDALAGQEIVAQDGATGALAQAMIAQVQARYVMAIKRPRSMDQVRQELLRECERPSFAKAAWYRKPIGQGVEGLSIRFVEAALRIMRNTLVDAIPVSDDDQKRIVMMVVTDLESNTTYNEPIVCSKLVEKKKPDEGAKVYGKRKNSYGEWTYLVQGTDDEILNKLAALKSKAIRTAGLRLIPGDLVDECKSLIVHTRTDDAARDPDAERKELVDLFERIRVPASGLAEYVACDLGMASPVQLVELRAVYQAIRDGEATWVDCLAASQYRAATEAAPSKDPKIAAVREKIAARARPGKKGEKGESDPELLARLREGIAGAKSLDDLKPHGEELKKVGKSGKGLTKADYDALAAEVREKFEALSKPSEPAAKDRPSQPATSTPKESGADGALTPEQERAAFNDAAQ